MNLIIDIGNTLFKVGLFSESKLIEKHVFGSKLDFETFVNSCSYHKATISSVGKFDIESLQIKNLLVFNSKTPIPILNMYGTKATLGLDRLAAAIGAWSLNNKASNLVIDCGTCITYDYVNANSEYLGGGISPGIEMKFKALNNFTAKLPLVTKDIDVNLVGKSTSESIQSGVINGTVAEISGIIQSYKNISDNLAPVLCGGDAQFIANELSVKVKVEENLVLIGLNKILNFNE